MKKLKEKKCFTILTVLLPIMVVLMALPVQKVQARRDDKTILDGIYVDQIDLSGMTVEEANNTVNAFLDELKQRVLTFGAVDEHYVAITVGDLNLTWTNPEVPMSLPSGISKVKLSTATTSVGSFLLRLGNFFVRFCSTTFMSFTFLCVS